MNKHKILISFFCALLICMGVFAHEWSNIVPESRIGGRMASNGYMRGKVVLLDCRDYTNRDCVQPVTEMESVWVAYKSKPFVAIGNHIDVGSKPKATAIVKRLGVTFPIYCGVTLFGNDKNEIQLKPGVYVFDSLGRRVYFGNSVQAASGVVGSAILSCTIPSNVRAWKDTLDYEIAYLPGHAYLRLKDLQKRKAVITELNQEFPDDLKSYVAKWKEYQEDKEVQKLAKLVEITMLIKDRDKQSAASRRITASGISTYINKYSSLSKSQNEFIAQEAKNCIADLKFVQASLKK